MKRFHCPCGARVFFSSLSCLNCGHSLAYDPAEDRMMSIERGSRILLCGNRETHVACNWLADDHSSCRSCRMSQMIPGQHIADNRERWRLLEQAKRRLVRDLLRQGLPVDPSQLSFEFKEDQRTNADVAESFVTTGHSRGVITINAAEADDVFREQMRVAMQEPYRTLLGHMRHESGHFYFAHVVPVEDRVAARTLFGDERADYAAAVESYYASGPAADWSTRFVSAYASSHPAEDWAESWAHYLHLSDLIETARAEGIVVETRGSQWRDDVVRLVVTLNELNRSLGLPDAYPFLLTHDVMNKIDFVRRVVTARVEAEQA